MWMGSPRLTFRSSDDLISTAVRVAHPATPSKAHPVARCHCGAGRRMDRPASHRGMRLGELASIPHLRSTSGLWRGIYAPHSGDGHSRQTDSAAITMAKRTCGATDRLDQTRVRRSCDRLRRPTSASSAALVPAVLQRHPNTSVTGQGLTGAEMRPCHGSILPLPILGGLHHHYVRI